MRTNYVLIDYENVQPAALAVLDQDYFKTIVFVGASQVKLSFEVASAIQRMGDKASYVKISGNGPNALDFHIAFYIGQIAVNEPTAYFHIISKDAGFDPLIAHLKTKKILAARSKDITEIPLVKAINSKTPAQKQAVILDNLQHRGASRPRTIDALSTTINSLFQKSLPEDELALLLARLADQGYITVTDSKVSYALPAQHC
jgi:PIN domain